MHPLPDGSLVLDVGDVLVTDITYEQEPWSPEHEHEIAFVGTVLAGTMEKRIGPIDLSLQTTGAYVMPADVPHRDSFPTGARVLALEIKPATELSDACSDLLAHARRLRADLAAPARQIAAELRAQDDLRSLAVEGLSLELVAAAARSAKNGVGRTRAPAWLKTVDEYLAASFFRPLRIAEVASVVHVHPAHLARVFRTHHGETIGRRVRRLRLDWATEQLLEGDLPLREIAARAGFAHQSHFSREFKKHTGLAPAQYRERLRAAA
jgi:AraC family transcriptional regulator